MHHPAGVLSPSRLPTSVLPKAATLLAVALCAILAGCAQPRQQAVELAHIHGLAAQGPTLYVATHTGLATLDLDGGGVQLVGSSRDDFMGFVADWEDPGVFYSSGHPSDPRAFGGVHLGLRRSMDGGITWEQRSLAGQVDFHALVALPGAGRIAGWWDGQLMASDDGGAGWRNVPMPQRPLALAASEGTLWAGTLEGLLRSGDEGVSWNPVPGAPAEPFTSLALSRDGQAILAALPSTSVSRLVASTDGGLTWSHLEAPGTVGALAIDPQDGARWFVGLAHGGVTASSDAGATWSTLL